MDLQHRLQQQEWKLARGHRGKAPRWPALHWPGVGATPVALACCVACMGLAVPVLAQAATPAGARALPLALQESPWLAEGIPRSGPALRGTTQLDADRLEGQLDHTVTARGNAVLRQPGSVVKGDVLHYDQPSNTVSATGNVSINRQGNVYRGDHLALQLDTNEGSFQNVRYQIARTGGLGKAARLDFLGQRHSVGYDAVYSTCAQEDQLVWRPAWYIRGKKITLDTEQDEGYVEGGALVFKDVPILPLPSGVGFPLSGKRRSGLLPPTLAYNTAGGFEYAQPYYFNIAPNRDATVMPTIISRRGVNLYGQFRYLENNYNGSAEANYLPHDRQAGINRWHYKLSHTQGIPTGVDLFGTLNLSVNLNRVSDNNYWTDFAGFPGISDLSQRLLSNDARLGWTHGDWSGFVFGQRWQTLQQPAPNNIVPPFDRLPQVHVRHARNNVNGFDYSLDLDGTVFRSDPSLTGYPNGQRSYALGQISYPLTRPWGYFTPTAQLHASHYQTNAPMPNGASSASRVLPTVTLDGGLVYERNATLFGRKVQQTLEPRLFYAYTPYRDQSFLPVYDTALKDFNLSSIFSANQFTGNDRISDSNALTAGVSSHLYDAGNGAELARFTVAGRRQFHSRQVTLNAADVPATRSFSDILLDANLSWSARWSMRASVDYDPSIRRSMRSLLGVSYSPGPYRTVSANYRLQRDVSEQVDIGWQWPLNDLWGDTGKDLGPGRGQGGGRWYSVGRLYYSLFRNEAVSPAIGRGLVDGILGLEYDGCCWIARIALRRQQTQIAPVRYNNKIMFQLEFTGLSRLGSSPVPTFRDNIPNYMLLRDRNIERSRFGLYD